MIEVRDLQQWLEQIADPAWTWFAKRLSANDTGLTNSRQVGIYLPKSVAFPLLGLKAFDAPQVDHDRLWRFRLLSHGQHGELRLIFYRSKKECRLTRFGGRRSPIQDPENTSRILVMAFGDDNRLDAWLATSEDEEQLIQDRLGPVVPGIQLHRRMVEGQLRLDELIPWAGRVCETTMADLPAGWALEFPAPVAISAEAVRRVPSTLDPDTRLLRRYECEFRLFRTVEEAHLLPRVAAGFQGVDEFLGVATSVLNRRKARAGRALELHLAAVFAEEGVRFASQAMTEPGSVVDFLFPSLDAYGAEPAGSSGVRMLAVKTTLKDRWRQVLAEGSKISPKHLFTLDEGVSLSQYQQVKSDGIELVVPQRNVAHFPEPVRNDIMTLRRFLDLVRPLGTTRASETHR